VVYPGKQARYEIAPTAQLRRNIGLSRQSLNGAPADGQQVGLFRAIKAISTLRMLTQI